MARYDEGDGGNMRRLLRDLHFNGRSSLQA